MTFVTAKTDVTHERFNEAYEKLNDGQRAAVDTIEGPVMVIAGPGTGKTQILTLRIANILKCTDARPENILALTFTESGAKAMRERLFTYIGAAAYRVPMYTFHGFAAKLIGEYPDAYQRVIGGRPISDLEQIHAIENILDGGQIKSLRPLGNPAYYVGHIRRIIGQLKQEYVTPDKFSAIVERQAKAILQIEQFHTKGAHKGKVRSEYTKLEKVIDKNRELLFVYKRYEATLVSEKLFDFGDMIIETVEALEKNEDMLRDLQETYQYLLADEHQDVNGSQNKILTLLASFHDQPNIFAVGDEKQAIYRFQGATLENFLYFTTEYPGAAVISLTDNYRSGQTILDAAHSLIKVDDGPLAQLRVPLESKTNTAAVVGRYDFSHQAVEDEWLTGAVAADLATGVPATEIAVIVRTNREVESLATMLRKKGVVVQASADGDVLHHPVTESVLQLLRVIVINQSEKALFSVLHAAYWGIATRDLLTVFSAQTYTRSLWHIITDETLLAELGVQNIPPFTNVVTTITEARQREVGEAPHRVVEFLLQSSGLLAHVIKHDPFEGARVVRRLYDEIEAMVMRDDINTIAAVIAAFSTRVAYNLPINAPYIASNTDAVQVMTAHKSKGLEFEVVYVPHLTDNNWGGTAKKQYFDIPLTTKVSDDEVALIEDERRLLYVAMTRAKQTLTLSTSAMSSEGKVLLPSRLLGDLAPSAIRIADTSEAEAAFSPLAQLTQPNPVTVIDADIMRGLLSQRGLSATSLNNYLRNPWDYLYRNILRIPETQPPHMQFGTAVHSTLEFITRFHTEHGQLPTVSAIKNKLEIALGRLPVTAEEFVRLLDKGLATLVVYLDHLARQLPKVTREELKLRVHLDTGIAELPQVILTGNLDRIDIGADGRAYRVVDYKTGTPKSRNVIEGKTKEGDASYKRQLVFYALLLSLHGDERYVCQEGVLSFVEATSSGVVKEESFTITDEEIAELKLTIIQAVKEIISGDFLTAVENSDDTEYYDLSELWQKLATGESEMSD